MPISSSTYGYFIRYINVSDIDSCDIPSILTLDGIDSTATTIMLMSISQPSASRAPSMEDISVMVIDGIYNVSMTDP
jgi:hypothetical protein